MNLEKFTDRARGFLQAAQTVALRMNHQRIAPAHLLKALLEDEQGMASGLIARSGGSAEAARRETDEALGKIPVGTTLSYGALAARLDMPKAVRAVGHANGSNPISVVLPCHRLSGADGSLVKYGGGLERKRWLLAHEGVAL